MCAPGQWVRGPLVGQGGGCKAGCLGVCQIWRAVLPDSATNHTGTEHCLPANQQPPHHSLWYALTTTPGYALTTHQGMPSQSHHDMPSELATHALTAHQGMPSQLTMACPHNSPWHALTTHQGMPSQLTRACPHNSPRHALTMECLHSILLSGFIPRHGMP